MTMQDMLNDLIARGLITQPTPDAMPQNPDDFSYVPTITTYRTDFKDSVENEGKDAKLE